MTKETPAPSKLTPEQKEQLLRSMRRSAIMMDVLLWLFAIAVVGAAYLKTGSEVLTIAIAIPVFAYLAYHTYKQFMIGRD